MTSFKCPECGLVNFPGADSCKICGVTFESPGTAPTQSDSKKAGHRPIWKRLVWISVTTLVVLLMWYLSLRMSSNTPNYDQREVISKAIAVLDSKGFSR